MLFGVFILNFCFVFAHEFFMQDVKENPIMLYIKGVPDAPRCGFSKLAVSVLQQYGK